MLPAGSLQNLHRLSIRECRSLKDPILPPILPIPNKLEDFPSLRELEISGCHSLTYLLSWRQAKGLPHLQTLKVIDCDRMDTLIKAATDHDYDNSLASAVLQNLESLYVWECKSLKDDHILPPILPIPITLENFPSLLELNIAGCRSLTYLLSWRQAKGLPLLQKLEVRRCERMETVIKAAATDDDDDDKSLASAVQLLPRLESIILSYLPELRSVWGDDDGVIMLPAGSLQNLQYLYVDGCKRLKDDHILPPILPIRSLRQLEINRCDSLTYLLSWRQAKGLPHLKSLEVENCERMETVIKAADDDDKNLLASAVQLLPRLESIILSYLPELRSVWGDDGVIMLPAGSRQNLQTLEVKGCKRLKDDHILPPILPIPNKLENFPSLRRLEIEGRDSLTYLLSWRQAKGLPHLQYLEVENCERMETVIKAATDDDDDDKNLASAVQLLPSLESIHLMDLPELRSVWGDDGVIMLPAGSLQNLEELHVWECKSLKDDHILPPILPIPSLRELEISGCDSLTYLLSWRQAKGLPHLQHLEVAGCPRMETVIKEEEEEEGGATDKEEESTVLPSLTELTLNILPTLRSFFQGEQYCSKSLLSSFKSLKDLKVVKCPKLKKLPLSSSSPVLESLWGDSLEWFESFEWGEDENIKERLRPVFECEDESGEDESDEDESAGMV